MTSAFQHEKEKRGNECAGNFWESNLIKFSFCGLQLLLNEHHYSNKAGKAVLLDDSLLQPGMFRICILSLMDLIFFFFFFL